ncbi:MAG: hypothetical protein H7099_14565 [Gemmatimonadaceae bacterium]|nr:hypothetical protein [Gemmatimonadaceae bacterium]
MQLQGRGDRVLRGDSMKDIKPGNSIHDHRSLIVKRKTPSAQAEGVDRVQCAEFRE